MITLPALSLRQPWAWLVLNGKNIENRKWNTKFRGTFLIHASKGMTRDEYDDVCGFALDTGQTLGRAILLPPMADIERGGIVGAARLVDVHMPGSDGGPWHFPEQHGFKLEAATPLPFRAYKGALGFFKVELTPAEADALRAAGLAA